MKKLGIVVAVVVVCVCFLCASESSAQAVKIGVFDMQKIVRDYKKMEGYRQILMKNIESKRRPLRDKEETVRLLDEKLKKDGPSLSAADRATLAERLGNEAKEMRRLREDFDVEAQKMDRELTQKALAEIDGIVKKIGEKENYTIIVEKNSGGVVYLKDSTDITARIIAQLQ
jgi:outer membrane protein